MQYRIGQAEPDDLADVLALMPRLAAFPLPETRQPEHLWQGDAEVIRAWSRGEEPDCFLVLARGDEAALLGLALVRLQPEPLSHAPSSHLEALVVAEQAQGLGIGAALIGEAEKLAVERGAESMTLNVFTLNERARALYRRLGFAEELIRCSKPLGK